MAVRRNGKDDGFTLVELLIVIVILGILATVTVMAVRGITDRGDESACATDRRTLHTATEAYFAQTGGTSVPPTGSGADAHEVTLVSAGLLKSVSINYNLAADGSLSPQASACT
jgi:prepilin-type N-terminal cleavage/methylation domain-containing protein